ncbi:MAG: rod shape-determining protein [Candidatus Omnitrophica bacterium]|nr:rod shape-determining protein [Candidatus Omnitrophota bacterium]
MDNAKEDLIFALDIGTRKVVGIIAQKQDDVIHILDVEKVEHQTRTMLDGQIHNINEVAKSVINIKETLEKRSGLSLSKVGVAVAGRALKTVKAKISKELSSNNEITEDQVLNLDLEAVSSILKNADNEIGHEDFYCVGYSVVCHELDSEVIGDLVGHFGKSMGVEVIATFLPRIVLDSMLSVLRRAGLEVSNLTLEPIAALNAIIPKDIRRLNLVLLDIGAGTSDIALTKEGSVFAYGMVPEAGDEITELICEKFILDFNTAENVKRLISKQETVSFKDILGKEHNLVSADIIDLIKPRIAKLADSIANQVLELNQKVPNAIILVGGGSLTPLFDQQLSRAFPLDLSNIGIRLPEMVSNIIDKSGKLNSPDMVTPLGICIMTANSTGLKFLEIYVNEKRVNVLDMQQSLDVLSALVVAGVSKMKLYGRIGRAICVEVNGKLTVIKGEMGRPAEIKLNDQAADLMTKIKSGDKIFFKDAIDGLDAQAVIGDIVQIKPLNIQFNGNPMEIMPKVTINGELADLAADLPDRAVIQVMSNVTARDVLESMSINPEELQVREIVVRVNKEPKIISQSSFSLLVNGQKVGLFSNLSDGSVIEFEKDKPIFYKIKDIVQMPDSGDDVEVFLNKEKHVLKGPPGKIYMNGQLVGPEEFIIDRAEIITSRGGILPPTVAQILERLPISIEDQRGKQLKITVNGNPGGFTTPLSHGADISIDFLDRY